MALPKVASDKIKALGFDVDKLIAAIKADNEVEYEVPDIEPISKADLEARDAVKIAEGEKLAEPKVRKLIVTEIGKKLNIELKSERIGELVTELQSEMSKTNDEKAKLLTEQVKALTIDKTNLEQKIIDTEKGASAIKFDSDLINYFPANRGTGLSDKDRLMLIKGEISFETVEGITVCKKNGEVIRNTKTQAPLEVAEVIKNAFTEKPLLLGTIPAASGGRGGTDNTGGNGGAGIKNMTKAKEAWLAADPEKNTNTMSPEFTNYVNDIASKDKEFDFYN